MKNNLLIALCIVGISFMQACSDRVKSFYPSIRDAANAGAITHGWIPNYLPENSRKIYEVHDIDSSVTWCVYEFSIKEAQSFKKALSSEVNSLPKSLNYIKNPGITWWPEFLRGEVSARKIKENGFHLYVVKEPCFENSTSLLLFAVNWQKECGYFYRAYCAISTDRERPAIR